MRYGSALIGMTMALGLSAGIARAQDQQAPAAEQKKAQPAASDNEETKNARALALEGSKSPWSGQLQLTYLGSSLNHPFSDELANPSHQDNPSPVSLSGIVAVRYRFNDTTT